MPESLTCRINDDLIAECLRDTKPVAGTEATIAISDLGQIDRTTFTFNINQYNIVSAITKPFGSRFYKWQGVKNSNEPINTAEGSDFFINYSHAMTFRLFETSPNRVEQIENLENSIDGAMLVYEDKNGRYRIQGSSSGLDVVTSTQTQNDEESAGGLIVEMNTGNKEAGHPLFLGIWDYTDPENPIYDLAASKALFEGLFVKEKKATTGGTAGATTTFVVTDTSDIPVNSMNQYSAMFSDFTDSNLLPLNGTTQLITVISNTEFTVAFDSTGATDFIGSIQ